MALVGGRENSPKRFAAAPEKGPFAFHVLGEIGAGEGIRTPDPNLGKVGTAVSSSFPGFSQNAIKP
jgi:hypothetical protein